MRTAPHSSRIFVQRLASLGSLADPKVFPDCAAACKRGGLTVVIRDYGGYLLELGTTGASPDGRHHVTSFCSRSCHDLRCRGLERSSAGGRRGGPDSACTPSGPGLFLD